MRLVSIIWMLTDEKNINSHHLHFKSFKYKQYCPQFVDNIFHKFKYQRPDGYNGGEQLPCMNRESIRLKNSIDPLSFLGENWSSSSFTLTFTLGYTSKSKSKLIKKVRNYPKRQKAYRQKRNPENARNKNPTYKYSLLGLTLQNPKATKD